MRKVFSREEIKSDLGKELLKPTRIYVKPVLRVMKKVRIMAIAHITGGGFYDNIPRILPEGLSAEIKLSTWPVPAIFKKIQERAKIETKEMHRTFNMGIGIVLITDLYNCERLVSLLKEKGEDPLIIGEIVPAVTGTDNKERSL